VASDVIWWLEGRGARRRVSPAGLLIGRSTDCDLILDDSRSSRKQALIHAEGGRLKLLVLGRGQTRVGDAVVDKERELAPGDVIALPGMELRVGVDQVEGELVAPDCGWLIRAAGGATFGVVRSPFMVGSGAGVDLDIDGLPERAFELVLDRGRLNLIARAPTTVDDRELESGMRVELNHGSEVLCGDINLAIAAVAGGAAAATLSATIASLAAARPGVRKAVLQFLPRGGRLTLAISGKEHSVYLPDRRCDLVATLLKPPDGSRAGGFVDDQTVIARVWPNRAMTRSDLNVLVHRVRKSLATAGLDGAALLERARGGGGTRLVVADDAEIGIE
jgi:hypothetical protein